LAYVGLGGALVVLAAACSDIGLSTASDSPAAGGVATPASPIDASFNDAGFGGAAGDSPTLSTQDSGVVAASTSVGNPLCFFAYGAEGGAHTCQPDDSSQCPQPPDGGTFTEDAAAVTPPPVGSGGGESDAGGPACHVIPLGQACWAAGTGGDGAQCQTSTDCAASFECVGSPGQCRHYCCNGNTSCDTATFCDVQATADGGVNVPVCEPITSCTLLLTGTGNGSCPKGETCAVVKDDGTTSCMSVGPVGVGQDCSVYHCAANLTCLGSAESRTCFQLCQVDAPSGCPYGTTCTSSAQLFTNANIGICQ
jgi:hypothetical protein